jgi:hypothetical protein
MKNFIKQLFIVVTLSSLTACAGTPGEQATGVRDTAPRRNDCIHEPSIRGYTVLDEQNLLVKAAGRRSYHVVLARRAFGLRSSWGIAFRSSTGRICEGFSEVLFEGHFDGESIRIVSIRELSPEEREAILIDFGKKAPEIKSTPVPQEVKGADVEELDVDDDE